MPKIQVNLQVLCIKLQLKRKQTPNNHDQLNQANQYRPEMDFAKLWDGFKIRALNLVAQQIHFGNDRAPQHYGQHCDNSSANREPWTT